MAELLGTTRANISLHLRNVYASAEPEESATCKEFLHVRQEGQRQISRRVARYNLDAIISMGYRVNSVLTTQFRR
ncbi:RhuM family protein [Actinomyces gerencseriae]